MRVYKVSLVDKAQRLGLVNQGLTALETEKPLMELGKGRPVDSSWQCPPLRPMISDRRRKYVYEDVSAILAKTQFLLFSPAVRSVLEQECGISEQWLEASFDEKPYSILNLVGRVEALDWEKTEALRFDSGGLHMVRSYVFNEPAISDLWLFKDAEDTYPVFCTDRFIELVDRHGFTGFWFDGLWDSKLPAIPLYEPMEERMKRPEIYGPRGFKPGLSEWWPPEWIAEGKAMKKRGEKVNW